MCSTFGWKIHFVALQAVAKQVKDVFHTNVFRWFILTCYSSTSDNYNFLRFLEEDLRTEYQEWFVLLLLEERRKSF